jgi:pimeloyl-ACP methyl ester carboxylesterase
MNSRAHGEGASTAQIPVYRTEDNRAGLMSLYEEKLRQWPVRSETFFVATRYGKTHVIASGDPASPPVVLLHPEATSALAWAPLFPALAGRYRIYAPDTIGWPVKISDATLRTINAPTLLFLGGQDGAVGSASAAASRARRTIARCQIEILPKAGHLMIFDEPEFIGGRTAEFLANA